MPPVARREGGSLHSLHADPARVSAEAVDKIAAVRVWLLKEKPFFGVLARALVVVPTLATAALRLTADDRLLVNPLVILEARFPALCARIAHLALHAALGAYPRRGEREPLRWNVAHDLAIAPLLRAARMPVGPEIFLEGLGEGASAEQCYLALEDGVRPDDMWCDLADPPPKEAALPPGIFTRQDSGDGDEGGEGSGAPEGEGGAEEGRDAGEPQEGEAERAPDGDVDAPVPKVLARGNELQWKMRLGEAMEEERASGGKTFGAIPAWLEELVRATIEPPLDWAATLQRSISMLSRSERTFTRPSRRMSALVAPGEPWPDVVAMPGRRVVPAGRIVAVIDTSASIDVRALSRFLGALASVATAEGFDEVRLVQADAEVTRDQTVLAAELLFQEIAIVGRGGTDFRPALALLEDESRRFGERFTVVYLTDLDGRFPEREAVRLLEVLWVVPGAAVKLPPFGRVVEMEGFRR